MQILKAVKEVGFSGCSPILEGLLDRSTIPKVGIILVE
ncbi:hypothetical protein MPNT_40094 [Candidatus Methylacidithermus pantelleriae]|uniref:Uncharacterized protein n=1 Tax=Candidatus Methylacidithermus pantelleriae TaxID=2744239 RepID=A0A8J2FSX0_9BACT|nr:hypothetical protein MPNT_40094 [Candidatus Methylacidithermus pantelleriae]